MEENNSLSLHESLHETEESTTNNNEITKMNSISFRLKQFSKQSKVMSRYLFGTEDEYILSKLGYKQEVKRVFNSITSFGIASSVINVLGGVIPLYSFQLQTGGPVVMTWTWLVVGIFSTILASSLGEISSAFPTMGALY